MATSATEVHGPFRIAMISYYLPSGSKIGVGYQAHEIANELVRRGHEVDVFSDCPPVQGGLYGHVHLRMSGHLRSFRFATTLRRVDFSGYDVLHAHGDDYWLWRRRAPVHIRTMHGSCFEEALRIRGIKERVRMIALGMSEVLATLVADATVAVSPATLRWTPWVRRVIPNGIDRARFARGSAQRADRPTVLFVGTWHNRKRGSALAEAFAVHVAPRLPDAELVMVTQDAPERLPAGVRVVGRLSDDELAAEYRRAWVFCLPSTYEGFGIPYAEAMASGLPVVATPNVGASFVTDQGRAGMLVSLEELGPALRDLLEDTQARDDLARRGSARAERFDLGHVVERYERLYSEVAQRSGKRITSGANAKFLGGWSLRGHVRRSSSARLGVNVRSSRRLGRGAWRRRVLARISRRAAA